MPMIPGRIRGADLELLVASGVAGRAGATPQDLQFIAGQDRQGRMDSAAYWEREFIRRTADLASGPARREGTEAARQARERQRLQLGLVGRTGGTAGRAGGSRGGTLLTGILSLLGDAQTARRRLIGG